MTRSYCNYCKQVTVWISQYLSERYCERQLTCLVCYSHKGHK